MAQPGTVITGIGIGIEALALAKKQGVFSRIWNVWRKKYVVLILGATGTGKTNLINSLTELAPEAIDRMSRTAFVVQHRIMVKGHPFIFIDTPGQEAHRTRRMQGILEAMRRRANGVLNVVSYGYHEGTGSPTVALSSRNRPAPAFLEERRTQEITSLDEWKNLVGSGKNTPWLMTVVTKADLWWDEHERVMEYYQSGPYAQALNEAGVSGHVVLPYCSVYHRFYDAAPLAGSFDDKLRASSRQNLLQQLLEAIGKGGRSW